VAVWLAVSCCYEQHTESFRNTFCSGFISVDRLHSQNKPPKTTTMKINPVIVSRYGQHSVWGIPAALIKTIIVELLWNYILIYSWAEFSASLLQSSVSHDPLVIILIWWFDAQETFLIIISAAPLSIINCHKQLCLNIFRKRWHIFVFFNENKEFIKHI